MEPKSFVTLREFHRVVETCRISQSDRSVLSLYEGLEKAVSMMQAIDYSRKKVILIGNGGSSSIASHQAVDLWKNGGIRAIAFNDAALLTCAANDFGYPQVFAKPVEQFADPGDLLVAISSSGKSVNILNAVESARAAGCSVVTFSGFGSDNPLDTHGDLNFYLASHSYGIVEVGHLLLLHAIIDEVIARKGGPKK